MKPKTRSIPLLLALAIAVLAAPVVSAQVAPPLGQAGSFAVLGGSAVTNTGSTVLAGDLGVSPGSAISGFPPGVVSGTVHIADAVALQAQADTVVAYNALAGQAPDANLTGQDLGGMTLTAGVYAFDASAQLTGTLVLDAQGNPDAVFVFQIGSTLTTASGSSVQVINGGSNCNVFWQVGSSATLGTGTALVGNILALTSITLNTGASASGRLLARNGAVTLDTNVVSACATVCAPVTVQPDTLPPATIGVAYAQAITASGGVSPYTFTLVSGALPQGLSLAADGQLSGTPTTAGTASFTVRATDSAGCFGEATYTLIVGTGNGNGPPPAQTGAQTIPAVPPLGLLLLAGVLALAGWVSLRR